jgi:hypothetical protein
MKAPSNRKNDSYAFFRPSSNPRIPKSNFGNTTQKRDGTGGALFTGAVVVDVALRFTSLRRRYGFSCGLLRFAEVQHPKEVASLGRFLIGEVGDKRLRHTAPVSAEVVGSLLA